jgi:hypothetical protein
MQNLGKWMSVGVRIWPTLGVVLLVGLGLALALVVTQLLFCSEFYIYITTVLDMYVKIN